MQRPSLRRAALLAAAALTLALGGAPLLVTGADHLDAPALGGLTNMAGDFSPHSEHGDRDINDVYVFQGANASRTVLAMTTNPAVNLFGGAFGPNVRYIINVDTQRRCEAGPRLRLALRLADRRRRPGLHRPRYTGANARSLTGGRLVGFGSTGGSGIVPTARDGAKVFAGVRSDPFFFDLTGFIGTVFGVGDRQPQGPRRQRQRLLRAAEHQRRRDRGAGRRQLGGTNIGVWGTTSYWNELRLGTGRPDGPPGDQHRLQHQPRRRQRRGDQERLQHARRPSEQRTASAAGSGRTSSRP